MATVGRQTNIAAAALVVVLVHGAVLAWVVTGRPPAPTPAAEPDTVMQILNWKAPPPALPRTTDPIPLTPAVLPPPPAAEIPQPAAEAPTPAPLPEALASAAPAEPAPVAQAAPVPVALEATMPPVSAPAPAAPEYLPQAGVTLAPVVPAGELLQRIQYPDKARRLAIQGTVNLELFIDREGLIRRVEVLKDPGYGFAEAALKALEGLVCRPAELAGTPVAVRFRYPVRFTLK